MKNNVENNNRIKIEYIILILYSLIMLAIHGFRLGYNVLWRDEAFTAWISDMSINELINTTANDVHPPLYYLIIKLSLYLFGNSVYIYRGVSYIAYAAMIILALTFVRRRWGASATFLMITFQSALKNTFIQNVEIRMYAWALLMVFASYVFALYILEKGDIGYYVGFFVTALCSAYLHYYALVSVAIMAFLLLCYCIVTKYNVRRMLIADICAAICYLPWFVVLYKTFRQKKDDYWIQSIPSFGECMRYLYDSQVYLEITMVILTAILVILAAFSAYNNMHSERKTSWFASVSSNEVVWIVIGAVTVIGTALIGIGVSRVFRPLFQEKYMYPCIAVAWIVLAVCIKYIRWADYIMYGIAVVVLVLCIPIMSDRINSEKRISLRQKETLDTISKYSDEDTSIWCVDDSTSRRVVLFHFPDNSIYEIEDINDSEYNRYKDNKIVILKSGFVYPTDDEKAELIFQSGRLGSDDVDVYNIK